jgi:hypothetical protein
MSSWYGVDSSGLGKEQLVGSYRRGNEPLGSIRRWEDPEQLHNWQLS